MKLNLNTSLARVSPEAIFAAKYDWLFGWAMHFSQGDRATAEDLVQDTFVRFALCCTDLKDPEHAEPLLYSYLKYVHLAHLRRLRRYPHEQLSVIEFDSLELGMRSTPVTALFEVQDDLRQSISYLTWRKDTAKSASILILRFLHGFYPDEIARITLLKRARVDRSLSSARDEIKQHLANPGKVVYIDGSMVRPGRSNRGLLPTDQLTEELREHLFTSCRGECPSAELLNAHYADVAAPIPCILLAHIVSCQKCLDSVCQICGVPPFSNNPSNRMDRTSDNKTRPSHSPRGDHDFARMFSNAQKRLREIREHRPRRLAVIVNGHSLAVQNVTSVESQLEVDVAADTELEMIEVVSEQGLCLFAMAVSSAPPEHPPEVTRRVELSAGRSISVRLSFTGDGSQISFVYFDPTWLEIPLEDHDGIESHPAISRSGSRQKVFVRTIVAIKRWGAKARDHGFLRMNPTLATVVIVAAVILGLMVNWLQHRSVMPPDIFLERAAAWEAGTAAHAGSGVIYQRLEIHSGKQRFERNLYRDVRGIRRAKPSKLAPEEQALSERLQRAGISWNEPLSVANYRDWHDHASRITERIDHDGQRDLTLTTTSNGSVASESLTVRDSDFHPVARKVEMRDGETIEVAELNYAILPWNAVNQDWFDTMPESVPNARPIRSTIMQRTLLLPTDAQLDAAELDALLILSNMHLDTDVRLRLVRTPMSIDLEGVVDTAEERHQIEMKCHHASFVTSLVKSQEDLREEPAGVEEIASIKQSSDVAQIPPLESFLVVRGISREAVAGLSQHLLNSAIAVNQRSRMLSSLKTRFGSDDKLNSASKDVLQDLLSYQSSNLLAAIDAEERAIDAIEASRSSLPQMIHEADEDLVALGEHNYSLCKQVASGAGSEVSVPETLAEIRLNLRLLRTVGLSGQEVISGSSSNQLQQQRSDNR